MEDMQVMDRLKKKQTVRIVSPEWVVDPSVPIPIRTVSSSVAWIIGVTRISKRVSSDLNPDHAPVRKEYLC